MLLPIQSSCTSAATGSPRAGGGRYDHSADRVIVPQLAHINGVAVTQRHAFITSEYGVATFDRLLDAWLPPVGEPEPGFPRRILGVVAHPLDDAAWVIEQGALVRFEPMRGWSLRTTVVGSIEAVLFDRRDPQAGIWVRSLGGWSRVSPTGLAMPVSVDDLPPPGARIVPGTLEELLRDRPALRGYARLLTRDANMRSWPPSAGAEAPDGGEVWLGTWGYGVFRVDPEFLRAVHEPYGLLTPGAGALAVTADGVWIAGAGINRAASETAGALVFASADLRDWGWRSAGIGASNALSDARAMVVRGQRAWVATRRGAVRIGLDGASDVRLLGVSHGLPSDDVLAMVARLDGVWLGTSRGLVFVRETWDAGAPSSAPGIEGAALLGGTAVRALLAVGDTMWIGTDNGLRVMDLVRRSPAHPGSAAGEARLRRPMLALAHHDTIVAAVTATELLLLDARTGTVQPAPAAANVRAVGDPSVVRMDARTLWLGGSRGVLVVDRATGASRFLAVPREIPAPVLDLALSELFAWVATADGLVRLRRNSDGSIR